MKLEIVSHHAHEREFDHDLALGGVYDQSVLEIIRPLGQRL
jgi:hypothetical protein